MRKSAILVNQSRCYSFKLVVNDYFFDILSNYFISGRFFSSPVMKSFTFSSSGITSLSEESIVT